MRSLDRHLVPLIAVVIAGLAIVLVEVRRRQAMEMQQVMMTRGGRPAPTEELLGVLAGQLETLEEQIDSLRNDEIDPAADTDLKDALERIASMEATVAALASDYAEWSIRRREPDEERPASEANDLGSASTRVAMEAMLSFQATALDESADPRVRVKALRMLARFPPELAAFGPVLDDLAILHSRLTEAKFREDLVDSLDDVQDARVTSFLVGLLGDEVDPGVRVEAVRALARRIDEPGVRNALIMVRDSDGSEDVRRAAGRVLDG